MRTITRHQVNPVNDTLAISVLDERGAGGANHKYSISWGDPQDSTGHSQQTVPINFQNGPINEHGVNGVTQEALLAIVIDRLQSFQNGPFKCRENAIALTHIETGLIWLQQRTLERMRRGVEGTNKL